MSDGEHNKGVEKVILPTDHASERTAKQLAKERRIRVLQSRAAVAHSEVDAIAASHLDPDTLETMLSNANPSDAQRIRKAEHTISIRVADARAIAEAAEAEYEQAALDKFDESND